MRKCSEGREIAGQFKMIWLQYLRQHSSTTTKRRKDRQQKIPWQTKNYLTNSTGAKYYQLRIEKDGMVSQSTSHKRRHFSKVK